MTIMIKETMKTSVVGAEREILHSQSVLSPQGQYLLRASIADNGIVAAKAKSVTAKWNIRIFRGVRTWEKKYQGYYTHKVKISQIENTLCNVKQLDKT